jgi:hypothetical protein
VATYVENTAEGGTDGTTVTAANSGGASGQAFSSVTIGSGATVKFSAAAAYTGSLGYLMGTTAAVGFSMRCLNTPASAPVEKLRFYRRLTGYPTSTMQHIQFVNGSSSAFGYIHLLTTGQMRIIDANNATVWTSSASVPLNTWVRTEVNIAPGTSSTTGAINFLWAVGDGPPDAGNTFTGTGLNFGTTASVLYLSIGKISGAGTIANLNTDNYAWDGSSSDISTFLGPVQTSTAASASGAIGLGGAATPAAAGQVSGGISLGGAATGRAPVVMPTGMGFNWPNTVVTYVNGWDQQSTTYANRARPFQVAAANGVKVMRTFFGTVDSITKVKSSDGPTASAAWAGLQEILDTAAANGVKMILSNYLTLETIQALAGTTYANWAAAQVDITTPGSAAWNGLQWWISQCMTRFANHAGVFSWEVTNEPNYMLGMDSGAITVDAGVNFLDVMQQYLRTNGAKAIGTGGRYLYTKANVTDAQAIIGTRAVDYLDDHFYTEATAAQHLAEMDTWVARVRGLLSRPNLPVLAGEYGSNPQQFFNDITDGLKARGWTPVVWGYDSYDSHEFNESTDTYVLTRIGQYNSNSAPGTATGGITLGGASTGSASSSALGSVTLGGAATAQARSTSVGSVTLGGSGISSGSAVAAGSVTLAGNATATQPSSSVTGGVTLGGTATARASTSASGAISLGGTATGRAATSATGALSFGGTAAARAAVTTSGVITLAGLAASAASTAAQGLIALSGVANARAAVAATGTVTFDGQATAGALIIPSHSYVTASVTQNNGTATLATNGIGTVVVAAVAPATVLVTTAKATAVLATNGTATAALAGTGKATATVTQPSGLTTVQTN